MSNMFFDAPKFRSSIFSSELPQEDIDQQLAEYDYYEQYDSTKDYKKDNFTEDYGNGSREYYYSLYSFGTKRYVVANEIVSEDEYNNWVSTKSCQCYKCKMSWYNIGRFFTCAHCVGCIYSIWERDEIRPYIIKSTREYYNKNHNK